MTDTPKQLRVALGTDEFPAAFRRALRHHYGQTGMASRAECRSWARQTIDSAAEDVLADYYAAQDDDEEVAE